MDAYYNLTRLKKAHFWNCPTHVILTRKWKWVAYEQCSKHKMCVWTVLKTQMFTILEMQMHISQRYWKNQQREAKKKQKNSLKTWRWFRSKPRTMGLVSRKRNAKDGKIDPLQNWKHSTKMSAEKNLYIPLGDLPA